MNILVTGSEGFIGRNFIKHLRFRSSHNILEFTKKNNLSDLEESINFIDKVFHFAGSNNSKDLEELEKVNVLFTKKLCNIIKNNSNIELYFASSIQALKDNYYGKSKRQGEKICLELAKEYKNKVNILRLPGIFGGGCKPNYNSVVATFCFNVANNYALEIIDPKKVIELVYIDDLCEQLSNLINRNDNNQYIKIENIYKISVQELALSIKEFKNLKEKYEAKDDMRNLKDNLYKTYLNYQN